MRVKITNYRTNGEINVPTSKSALQRLIAASFLSTDQTTIKYRTHSKDSLSVLSVINSLGAEICDQNNEIIIKGGFNNPPDRVNIGESGLGLRMMTPIIALQNKKIIIDGSGSLIKRPVGFIVDALTKFGVEINTENGRLPISVKGRLKNATVKIDASLSSQLLTGLLMALPTLDEDSVLEVERLKSKPYIDLTINTLSNFGITIINEHYSKFIIKGKQTYKGGVFEAEGDWSAAAFLFVAGAISGSIKIKGLKYDSTQGDKNIVDIVRSAGAKVTLSDKIYTVEHADLKAFEYDATDTPDLFPPLAALAVYCNGKSIIKGVDRLASKESNRAQTIVSEFKKLGADIYIDGNSMIINGGKKLHEANVISHNDHRIAMALTIASANTDGAVIIDNAQAVSKSWPNFFADMQSVGLNVDYL